MSAEIALRVELEQPRTPAGWRLSALTITPVFEVPQA
jgi:hypothetical protein